MSQYLSVAQSAAERIPAVLAQRGLDPAISRYLLVETRQGSAWLFAVLDTQKTPRLEAYMSPDTIHQLSTALGGHPVLMSNSTGLRYAVLLSPAPRLPKSLDFPGWRTGLVQIGQAVNGDQVTTRWPDLGHVLVAGATGSGKSTFLRLLVDQAIREGYCLALADPDGRTFPMMAGHPQLLAPLGQTPDGCKPVIKAVLAEITRRIRLFGEIDGFPDDLEKYNAKAAEKLPRVIVVIDEFNGLALSTGGPKGELVNDVQWIGWQGRKFGVNLIVAGQEFTTDIVARVKNQMTSRVCFRVASRGVSHLVLGQSGAEKIKTPGRAWTTWGLVQTYRGELQAAPQGDGLSQSERDLAAKLIKNHQGRMSLPALIALGVPEREARRLRRDWEARGLAEVRPDQDNSLCVFVDRFAVQTGLDGLDGLDAQAGLDAQTGLGAPTVPAVPTADEERISQ